jgi:isocitrate dehydrogenase kinase/phosphatase
MFDVPPRRFIPENTLSFSVSMRKFERMVRNMEESFLTTKSWKAIQKRIQGTL